MPLGLLLQRTVNSWRSTGTTLSGWVELVALEDVLLARARSAFLVHWFGHRLPFDGLSLKVVITNLGDLNRRFLQAQRSLRTSRRGPNLTDPLLQFAGTVTGILLTPLGALTGAIMLLQVADSSAKVLFAALAWLLLPGVGLPAMFALMPRLGILLGIGLVGGGLFAGLSGGLSNRRDLRALYDLGGGLARLFAAATALLDQLLGPRSEVRNPLLLRVLEVADRLAALFAQILGFAAVLITRVAPVLAPVAQVLVGLVALGRAVGAALAEIVRGALERIDELLDGDLSPVALFRRMVGVARHGLDLLDQAVSDAMTEAGRVLAESRSAIIGLLGDAVGEVGRWIRWAIGRMPLVQLLLALMTQVSAFKDALEAVQPPPEQPGGEPSFFAPLIESLPSPPTFPDLPPLPETPDPAAIWRRLAIPGGPQVTGAALSMEAGRVLLSGTAPVVELGAEARRSVGRLRAVPAVVAPERRAAEQRFGGPPDAALGLNRSELEPFRQALNTVVGRILPPEMRTVQMPQLLRLLMILDAQLHGLDVPAAPAPRDLPVLDVPDSGRLRPQVDTLRLRMPGAHVNDVKRFEGLVLERLRGQEYRARAGVGGP